MLSKKAQTLTSSVCYYAIDVVQYVARYCYDIQHDVIKEGENVN